MSKVTRQLTVGAILSMALIAGAPASGQAPRGDGGGSPARRAVNNLYIVRMAEDPAVAYRGGIPGLQGTRPNRGQKIDPDNPQVAQYAGYLDSRHDQAVASAGGGRKVYDYRYSFNGFAAELTEEQAARLAAAPGVLSVAPNEVFNVDTASTPAFLELDAPGGLWEQLGGADKAGEDVIIGIVDSGVWPESLSFSDRTGTNGNASRTGKLSYQQIPGWHGKCVPGEAFNASHCNQKLIGARYYNEGWGGDEGIDGLLPFEFNSPRDHNGHGSHTASTAGGNANVPATGAAAVFGTVTGIAPRARIAAYKACWSVPGTAGSCQGVDLLAAIDQAVADGVDVINYSISGTSTNFRDAVEIAFLFAADAGVFVAASAGNSGPTTSTVAHPGPWLTTVAAGTHNRDGRGSVTLGNGTTYFGASVATPVTAPLIDSTAAGLAGADPTAVALCYTAEDNGGTPVLNPALVAGKIVVCQRGVTARTDKSLAVQQAGGVGMILINTSVNSINADLHFVPTVHLQNTDLAPVRAYAATAGATASIAQSTVVFDAPAPFTAAFSSRGPLRAGNGDLLKPDVIAPGQDILAAVAPPGNNGRDFDVYSGTSMSSPHVAGLAALLKNRRRDWSPMMIKSALMTTAYDVLDGPNTNPLVIFRQGAGHVRPTSAADPGLVFDSGFTDWLSFICGVQPGGGCTGVTPIDPSNLNVASIAIGDLAGVQTVTRRVTNVGEQSETYAVSYTGLTGITVSLPASVIVAQGATQSFNVSFTQSSAPLNAYTGGQITFTGSHGHVVRIPVVIRPVALAAPTQVSGSYSVSFGYNGPFTATPRGLIPAVVTPGTVTQDPDQIFSPSDPTGTVAIPVIIPAGSTYVRYALFDADVAPGSDMDLYVYQGATLVGASTTGTSAEEVNFSFASPTAAPINLTVYVHGWGLPAGTSPFTLHDWSLGTAAAGNMTVTAPAVATIGGTGAIDLSFSGLTAGTKYLGSVVYSGSAGMPSPTIVRIDR
jgi:subtilisin family serine protease